jgi:hypothetical protein
MQPLEKLNLKTTVDSPHQFTIQNQFGATVLAYTYYPALCASVHRWCGFVEVEHMKAIVIHIFGHVQAHRLPTFRIVTDLSGFEGGFSEVTDWFANEFLAKIIHFGFKGEAMVMPSDLFAQLSVDDFKETAQYLACEHVYFNTLAEGMAWLESHRPQRPAH